MDTHSLIYCSSLFKAVVLRSIVRRLILTLIESMQTLSMDMEINFNILKFRNYRRRKLWTS